MINNALFVCLAIGYFCSFTCVKRVDFLLGRRLLQFHGYDKGRMEKHPDP